MDKEYEELIIFISNYWAYKKENITKEKSLDDIGMYGDDKKDFLKSFVKNFKIDSTDLDLQKYCEPEIFNPFNIFQKDNGKIKITIEHLLRVIKMKKWFSPNK